MYRLYCSLSILCTGCACQLIIKENDDDDDDVRVMCQKTAYIILVSTLDLMHLVIIMVIVNVPHISNKHVYASSTVTMSMILFTLLQRKGGQQNEMCENTQLRTSISPHC